MHRSLGLLIVCAYVGREGRGENGRPHLQQEPLALEGSYERDSKKVCLVVSTLCGIPRDGVAEAVGKNVGVS